MERKLENALDDFNGQSEDKKVSKDDNKVVIKQRDGLTERINPIIIVEDGRQLLREQY